MQLLTNVLLDTLADSIRMLPFLFAAFWLLETLEQYSTDFLGRMLQKMNKSGPLIGALAGCIPQCGFSVLAANLYAGGILSPGTLLAVFLATSDEAILILMGHPGRLDDIFLLILTKLVIAIAAGYFTDYFLARHITTKKQISSMCNHCGCHTHTGVLLPAVNHTFKLFAYIFIISGLLNFLIESAGFSSISAFLLGDSIFQPLLAALIGFIPNCAASVILTELYLGQAISFASVTAGLCTNAGIGLVVLFRVNTNLKENVKLTVLLYTASVIAGLVLSL